MNYIYVTLFSVVFYLLFKQSKLINRELLKKQITDSLILGIMEYYKFQINALGFLVNQDNTSEKDFIKKVKERFADSILNEVYFYMFLTDSFESYMSEKERGKFLLKSDWGFNLFINKPSLIYSQWDLLRKMYICDEPLRELYLTVVLISLYKDVKTKERAIKMLEIVPIKVKETVLTVIHHHKFNELKNYNWPEH